MTDAAAEGVGFIIGFVMGLIILVAVCRAVHADCLSRGGTAGTATFWVVSIMFLPIVFLPLYFILRALAPTQPTRRGFDD